ADVARRADAIALSRRDVLDARRQARTMRAVAEHHRRLAAVVSGGDEVAVGRTDEGEIARLMPRHVVDAYAERALHAVDGGGGNPSQRRLLQHERLHRQHTIAAA